MGSHICHLTVKAFREPLIEVLLVFVEISIRDTDLLKAQFIAPYMDQIAELFVIRVFHLKKSGLIGRLSV